jgi:uncharacterized protein (TIGR00297 family)
MPSKAIPPARDRLQSTILVWIVAPLIFLASAHLVHWMILDAPRWDLYLAKSLALSAAFAFAAWALRAATPAAALIGGMVCLLLTCFTGSIIKSPLHSAVTPLIALFALTFLATRTGRKKKSERGLAESRKGRRASQVIANLGVAALFSNLVGDRVIAWLLQSQDHSSGEGSDYWILRIIILAVLAEATADTVSSEIGQAFGGTPILLTTFRRVDPGTDGAITLTGTATGILAAAFVTGAGALSMHIHTDQVCIAFAAAILGLFFDSLLGATVERQGWIGNDLVNFTSTAFAAAVVFPLTRIAGFFLGR